MLTPTPKTLHSAMLCAFGGFSVWTIGDAAIRYLRVYPPEQIALISAVFSLGFIVCFSSLLGGIKVSFRKPRQGLQMARGFILAVSLIATFYMFMHLDMVTAFAIVFTAPILSKIFAVFINRERIPLAAWVISLVGFAGVLIILRPGIVPVGTGAVAGLISAATFALGNVMTARVGQENQTPFLNVLYVNISVIFLTLATYGADFVPMLPLHLALTLFISMTSAIGVILMARAYTAAPAAYLSPLHYTQIIWGVLWGILFFGEYPDAWTMAGATVIIGAGLMLVWMSRKA